MNKILRFSFIVLLALAWGGMKAQTTIDFTKSTPTLDSKTGYTLTVDGYTFIGSKEKGSTVPTQNTKSKDLRHYAKNTLTISGEKMSQIVFTMSNQGKQQWATLTASVGTVTVDKEAGTTTWTYAEGATSLTLTVGDKNDNGTNTSKTAGQFDIDAATISTDGGGVSKSSANLAFSEATINHEVGTEFTAPTFSKATTAAVTFASDNEEVAAVNSEGTISLGGKEGKAVITATSEENDAYYAGSATCTVYVYHMNTYKQATEVKSGKGYLLVAKRDGNTYYAYPLGSTVTYGYASTSKIEGDAEKISIKSSYNDEFTFTAEGTSGYSIKDELGRYYTQSGTYKSFQLGTEPGAWTVEPQADGTFKIEMNGYYIQFGDGTYTSFGVYNEAKENTVMPYLYEIDDTTTGINSISANDASVNAPVYNLAGQKVSSSYKGVVIKAGKKFVQK